MGAGAIGGVGADRGGSSSGGGTGAGPPGGSAVAPGSSLGAAGLVDTLKGTGPFTVFAPVKLRKAERGLQVDVNKAGSPPIPESCGGHYVFVLPGGEEYIDEKEAK